MIIRPSHLNEIPDLKHVRLGSLSLLFEYNEIEKGLNQILIHANRPYFDKEFGFHSEIKVVEYPNGFLVINEASGDSYLFKSDLWEGLELFAEKYELLPEESEVFKKRKKKKNFWEVIWALLGL